MAPGVRRYLINRYVLAAFAVLVGLFVLSFYLPYLRPLLPPRPLGVPGLRGVAEVLLDLSGCSGLGCMIPGYGIRAVYYYLLAVVAGNLYVRYRQLPEHGNIGSSP